MSEKAITNKQLGRSMENGNRLLLAVITGLWALTMALGGVLFQDIRSQVKDNQHKIQDIQVTLAGEGIKVGPAKMETSVQEMLKRIDEKVQELK